MAPKKGLSFDEKRDRLLDLFTETAQFYTLKELEKLAFKRKGIVMQSVKDVLTSLVDDYMVNTDKCGVQTVFWCLPSEASQKKAAKLASLRAAVAAKERDRDALGAKVDGQAVGREETDEHARLLAAIAERSARVAQMDTQLERFAEFDPESVAKLTDSMDPVKEAANRWTDNVFCCQTYVTGTFGVERGDFCRQFDIPLDLDYL